MSEEIAAAIEQMEPIIVETVTGYLALSNQFAPIHIGVVGGTEDEARANFYVSCERWAILERMP
jgi:hypothetical protein